MISTPVPDRVLRSAIELKCSECYGALSMANALGGSPSADWLCARAHKLADLVAEVRQRKLDMADWKAAVDNKTLCDTPAYCRAIKEIHEVEQHGATLTDKGWYLDGVFLGDTVKDAHNAIHG